MKRIIAILMERDNLSYTEAANIVEEVQEEIAEAIDAGAGLYEIEDIIASELGLEPDYLEDFLL